MDSGNSSSMQSSSGGDDDVESKAESSSMSMSMPLQMPMPLFLDHHALSLPNYYNPNNAFLPSSLMFEADYLPNAAYSSHQQLLTPSTHLHLDTFRPDPGCTDRGGLPGSSPRPNTSVPHGLGNVPQYQPSSSSAATTTNEPTKAAKNPRKRARASRRAPTTVLTTDTSNFRAMVQEFTGFPAPPFSGSRKLDLFGSGSIFRSSPRGPDPLGHIYPVRPSTQKLQQPPLIADAGNANPNADANSIISTALMSTITSSIAQMAANTSTASNSNPGSSVTASLLNLPTHPSASHQNPTQLPNSNTLFTFPSLMHDHVDTINTPASGLFHRFGTESDSSAQDHLGAKWDRPQGHADATDGNGRGRWSNEEEYGRGSSQRVNLNGGCKMNYTDAAASSSSDYHHRHNNDEGLGNTTTKTNRAEGTAVDNWFGSSD